MGGGYISCNKCGKTMNTTCIPLVHTDYEGNPCDNLSFTQIKTNYEYEVLGKSKLR